MGKHGRSSKTFETKIERLVYGGAGLGRHQGKVVFVPFSVPGDRLLVRPVEEKKTFVRAEIVRIIKSGKGRSSPVCPYFENCGGCHWQHLEYSRQVEAKRQILEELFHHKFPQTRELPITMKACSRPFGYRSRARMQLRGSGAGASVGFFRHGSHKVQDVESCPLFRPALNEALSSLRQFKLKVDTDSASREMDMACSQEEDTWTTARIGESVDEGIALPLLGTRRREEVVLRRKVGELVYSVTASVFFQANDFMVSELVALVKEAAKSGRSDSAIDLFAGVGLFSLPLARQFSRVVAVESSPSASRFCAANAGAAGFGNIQTVCAEVSEWLKSEIPSGCELNLIVLDPPRAGAGADVMERIGEWAPETIIYVSCDPQTLSRDLARIASRNYEIDLVEGLDMFPQTYHFETVVRLKKN